MVETLADRIQQRLDALGLSERAASIAATGSDGTIRMIRLGKSENPRGDTLRKIARVLQVSEQWLLTGEGPSAPSTPRSEIRPAEVPYTPPGTLPRDLPVLGTVAGAELGKGAFQLTNDVVDYVRRPPGLIGAKDAYALYVEGESMVPRFEPGELVFVHPHRKVLGNDYVVIQEPGPDNGPRGFIKQFVKQTPTMLKTRQFNPAQNIDFPLRPGLVWHKVLSGSDLYGV
jgi:phage repressor protein C with HTH and peptisase S24 domain